MGDEDKNMKEKTKAFEEHNGEEEEMMDYRTHEKENDYRILNQIYPT